MSKWTFHSIGVRNKRDKFFFTLIVILSLKVSLVMLFSLPRINRLPPWVWSPVSVIALVASSIIFFVSYSHLVLGVASLFFKQSPQIEKLEICSPKVSCIIPACNEEKVIKGIVSDLLNQSYRNLEVVVVIDNCTDGTKQVLESIKDHRLHVIEDNNTKKSGKPLALNRAMSIVSGDIVAQFDADNRIKDRDMIRKAVAYFKFKGVDVVQSSLKTLNADFNLLTKLQEFEFEVFFYLFSAGRNVLRSRSISGGTGVFYKKSILEKVGYWDDELTEDFSMYCKLGQIGAKMVFASDVVCWDEKPPYWSILLRQRSRWQRGHMNVCCKRIFKWTGVLDFAFLITPFANLAWYIVSALMLLHIISGIVYWYPPVAIWFLGTLFHVVIYYLVLRKIGREDLMKYIPLQYVYSFHWLIAFLLAFTVKSWTKTPHGFR